MTKKSNPKAERLVEQLEDLRVRCVKILEQAEKDKNHETALAAIGETRELAETLYRLDLIDQTVRVVIRDPKTGKETPFRPPRAGKSAQGAEGENEPGE